MPAAPCDARVPGNSPADVTVCSCSYNNELSLQSLFWVGLGGGGQAELRADVRRPCGNMHASIHSLLFCSSSRVVSDAACMSVKHATSSRVDYRLPRMGPSHETGHGGGGGGCHAPCAPARRARARRVRVCFISASIVSAISRYRAGPGRDSHIIHNTQAMCIHILVHAPRPPLPLSLAAQYSS